MPTGSKINYTCVKLYRLIRLALGQEPSDRELAKRFKMAWRGFMAMKAGRGAVPPLEILERIAQGCGIGLMYVLEAAMGDTAAEEVFAMASGAGAGEIKLVTSGGGLEEGDGGAVHGPYLTADEEKGTRTAVVLSNPQGTIKSWEGQAEDIFGWKAEEIIGHHITILHPEREAKRVMIGFEMVKAGKRWSSTVTHITKHGELIKNSLVVKPILSRRGEVILMQGVIRSRGGEEQTNKSGLFNFVIAGIAGMLEEEEITKRVVAELTRHNFQARVFYLNPAGDSLRVIGHSFQGEDLKTILSTYELKHEYVDIPLCGTPVYQEVLSTGRAVFVEDPWAMVDTVARAIGKKKSGAGRGKVKLYPSVIAPLIVDGRPLGMIVVGSPMIKAGDEKLVGALAERLSAALQRARRYRSLVASSEKYRSCWQAAGAPFLLIDLASQSVIEANEEFQRLCGYDRQELAGKKPGDLFAPPDAVVIGGWLSAPPRSRRDRLEGLRLLTSKGKAIRVSLSMHRLPIGREEFVVVSARVKN